MQILLESHGISGFVDGSTKCPHQFDAASDVEGAETDDYKIWKMHDRALMQLIIATLSSTAISYVIGCVSSHDMWIQLKDRFSTISKARIFQMKSELQTIKKGSDTVTQYLQKIKDARDHLSAAGVYFEDDDIVILALNDLPSDYNTFRCMVRGRDNVLSLKDFRSQLLAESCDTPCLPHHHLLKDDGQPYSHPQQYHSIVGALQYLTFTRPDISFSVNQACQFMHNPMHSHVVAVKRILRYLKGTLDVGLHFQAGPLHLQAYSDADWAGDPNDRRSVSGSIVFLDSSPISWASKKQHNVSRSSIEAEYRALAIAAAELAWIRQLLCDVHIPLHIPPIIHCDNISAISLASNPVFHSRMKHLQIDYHFVRERVIKGDLLVQHVSSADQFADILTKDLSTPLFRHHCFNLMLGSSKHMIAGECQDIKCSASATSASATCDTLLVGQSLSASETLISQNGTFELGFFKPGTSVNIYLGIWYKNFVDKAPVWVANRESPSNDPASSKLELSADGNLVLLMNSNKTVWSTDLASSMSNTSTAEAVLLDDGNFVVRDGSNPSDIYWQSFDYPTDTWLPGAKLGLNKHTGQVQRLISWKNKEDPAPGMFSIGIDPNGSSQLFIEWNRSHRYWSSGDWDGVIFALVHNNILKFSHVSNENESYFTYSVNTSYLSRFVIRFSGQMQQLTGSLSRFLFWSYPSDQAEVYGLCGAFGVFNENLSSYDCECLKGFKPLVQKDWSSGCVRKSPLQCQNKRSAGKEDEFLKISNLTLPANSKTYQKVSAERCRLDCLEICSCVAYAYNKNSGCSLWEGDLINLQQNSGVADGQAGAEIYIRLAASEPELQIGNGSTGTGNIKRTVRTTLAVAIPTTLITFGLFMYFSCLRKGKLIHRGKEYAGHDLLLFDFDTDPSSTNKESSSVDKRKNRWSKNMELPLFSYESVSVATGQFSDKLGEGGFGPVYKGKLPTGLEIAVKRLSERSGQGLEEFRNETILIAKLQHRNLLVPVLNGMRKC
ncbi:hypothetical protein NC651_012338 [Populus alba x Populus x berolinensis]|nr:hypothetical protein NC651_012338 [Populus alba x Populus x berolinensis]